MITFHGKMISSDEPAGAHFDFPLHTWITPLKNFFCIRRTTLFLDRLKKRSKELYLKVPAVAACGFYLVLNKKNAFCDRQASHFSLCTHRSRAVGRSEITGVSNSSIDVGLNLSPLPYPVEIWWAMTPLLWHSGSDSPEESTIFFHTK